MDRLRNALKRFRQAGFSWFFAAILVLTAGQAYGYYQLHNAQTEAQKIAYDTCINRNKDTQVFRDFFDELLRTSQRKEARDFFMKYRGRFGEPVDCDLERR